MSWKDRLATSRGERKLVWRVILIEELDPSADAGIEQVWIDEAQRRYNSFLNGELEALPCDAVMARARSRLK